MAISSPADARARADRIRDGMEALAPDILAAWNARDWEALGYASWNEYVVGEFGGHLRLGRAERKEAVRELRSAGMSTRAIGSALGVSHPTIVNDIAAGGQDLPPVRITATDGKQYPATRDAVVVPYTTPKELALWTDLDSVLHSIEGVLSSDASAIAAAVPPRRRAATAKRLRKLGTGLGRIAWSLEGLEESNDNSDD